VNYYPADFAVAFRQRPLFSLDSFPNSAWHLLTGPRGRLCGHIERPAWRRGILPQLTADLIARRGTGRGDDRDHTVLATMRRSLRARDEVRRCGADRPTRPNLEYPAATRRQKSVAQ